MKIAAIILSLVVPLSAVAAPAVVQTGYGECFPATTCVLDFGVPDTAEENVTEGSLLVLTFRSDNLPDNAITSVTSEPGSRTWTKAKSQLSVTDFWVEVWYLPNAPAGDTDVTVTTGGSASNAQMRSCLVEYSGVATTDPVEATVSATGTSASANPGNITTLTANALIHVGVGADGNADAETWTPGSGYTIHNYGGQSITGSDKTMTQHRVAATAGSYGTTMGNLDDSWSGVAVVFKSAESGGSSSGSGSIGGKTSIGGKASIK